MDKPSRLQLIHILFGLSQADGDVHADEVKVIKEISVVNFDHNDVIRHPLVAKIVEAYQKINNDKG